MLQQENFNALKSKMLAFATIDSTQKVEIVAMFEESTQRECYFVFSAKKATSPRDTWELKEVHPSYQPRGTVTFDDFVMWVKTFHFPKQTCWINTKIMVDREEFVNLFERIANPYKYIQHRDVNPTDFQQVIRKSARALHKGSMWFTKRDRSFDALPKPAKDEVLVYVDHCVDCGQNHSLAHFPAGNTKCMGYSQLVKHPGLLYVEHRNRQFVFKFKTGGI